MKKFLTITAALATVQTSALAAGQFYVGGALDARQNKLTGKTTFTDFTQDYTALGGPINEFEVEGHDVSISKVEPGINLFGGYRFNINETFYVAGELNARFGFGKEKYSSQYSEDSTGLIGYKGGLGFDLMARLGMNLDTPIIDAAYVNVGISAQRVSIKYKQEALSEQLQFSAVNSQGMIDHGSKFMFGPKLGLGVERNFTKNLQGFVEANVFLSLKKDWKKNVSGNAVDEDGIPMVLTFNHELQGSKIVAPELKVGVRYLF